MQECPGQHAFAYNGAFKASRIIIHQRYSESRQHKSLEYSMTRLHRVGNLRSSQSHQYYALFYTFYARHKNVLGTSMVDLSLASTC